MDELRAAERCTISMSQATCTTQGSLDSKSTLRKLNTQMAGPSVYTLMAGYKAGIVPVSTPRRTCHCHSLQTTSLRVSPLPWPVGNGRLGRSDIPDIRPMPGRSRIRPDADQARGIRRARYSMLLQKRQQPPACRQVCRPPQQGFRYLGEHLWTNAAGHPVWEETVPQCSKVRQFDVVVRGDLAT